MEVYWVTRCFCKWTDSSHTRFSAKKKTKRNLCVLPAFHLWHKLLASIMSIFTTSSIMSQHRHTSSSVSLLYISSISRYQDLKQKKRADKLILIILPGRHAAYWRSPRHQQSEHVIDFISLFAFVLQIKHSWASTFPLWPSCIPISSSVFRPQASCACMCGSLRVKEDHSVWAEKCPGFLCSSVDKPFSPLCGTERAVIYMEVMEWCKSGCTMRGWKMMMS